MDMHQRGFCLLVGAIDSNYWEAALREVIIQIDHLNGEHFTLHPDLNRKELRGNVLTIKS